MNHWINQHPLQFVGIILLLFAIFWTLPYQRDCPGQRLETSGKALPRAATIFRTCLEVAIRGVQKILRR